MKLSRKTSSFRRSVHPHETSPLHGKNYNELSSLVFVNTEIVDVLQFYLKSDKIAYTLPKDNY